MKDIKAIWKCSVLVRIVDGNNSEGSPHEAQEAKLCGISVILLNLTGKVLDPWTKFYSDVEVTSLNDLLNVIKRRKENLKE